MGRGGGVAVLWKDSFNCRITSYSSNYIDMEVIDDSKGVWRLTGFYGYPERERRCDSWRLLQHLSSLSPIPWCIIGDFNDLLSADDKCGQIEHPPWLLDGFRNVVSECQLIDFKLEGYPYTWNSQRGKDGAVGERIDRAMRTASWITLFPSVHLTNMVASMSDHSPINLTLCDRIVVNRRGQFRFENSWLLEEGLDSMVLESWAKGAYGDVLNKVHFYEEDLEH